MQVQRRRPSHPLTGWAFVILGCAGLVLGIASYLWRCASADVPAWPVAGMALEELASVVRVSLPAAVLLTLGVLLPLQRWGLEPSRRSLLVRLVTTSLLVVLGGYWILRLNLVGFASLWARQQPLGDLLLPAALLENRVWSANIMVVFAVALLSLPLNSMVRRLLRREEGPRAPWPLWSIAGIWWIGLPAVLLLAGGV
jgi:hypothetical protein